MIRFHGGSAIDPLQISVWGLALSFLLIGLEYLQLRQFARGRGFLSIEVAGILADRRKQSGRDRSKSYRSFVALNCARILVGSLLFRFQYRSVVGGVCLVAACLILVIDFHRYGVVLEGADHMLLVVSTAAAFASFTGEHGIGVNVARTYVVAQLFLSYTVAGIAKLSAHDWRSGQAFRLVMATNMFGSPVIADVFSRLKIAAPVISWTVIVWELGFGLAIVAPPLTLPILAMGALFHLSNAVLMGLNRFSIIFISCYPLVIWASVGLEHLL